MGAGKEKDMFEWIAKNAATLITALVLLLILGGAVFAIIRSKKKGRTTCGCGCANCPMSGSCHSKK